MKATFNNIVENLVKVFTDKAESAQYYSDNEQYICLCAWCASIAPLTRNLIYYCVAVTACGITTANRKNKKNTVFSEKMCVFPCKFPEKYVPLQCQKEKEVTTIKTGGNCNSAPRL